MNFPATHWGSLLSVISLETYEVESSRDFRHFLRGEHVPPCSTQALQQQTPISEMVLKQTSFCAIEEADYHVLDIICLWSGNTVALCPNQQGPPQQCGLSVLFCICNWPCSYILVLLFNLLSRKMPLPFSINVAGFFLATANAFTRPEDSCKTFCTNAICHSAAPRWLLILEK